MKVKIKSAKGSGLTVDFAAKTIYVEPQNVTLTLDSSMRACPASKGHTDHKDWPVNGTHYIRANESYIAIDERQANIFNDADKKYWRANILAEQERLDNAIPGLSKLQKANNDLDNYHYEFNRAMDDEYNDGVNMPSHPGNVIEDLCKQYPRAALYMRADSYSDASNGSKSTAGDKAKKILESGGDTEEATQILDNWLPASAMWD